MSMQVVRNMTKIKNAAAKSRTWDKARTYTRKYGKPDECHHIWPLYMGGWKFGPRVLLDPAYHQVITNAFRRKWPYGMGPPSQKKALEIMLEVYKEHPIDGFTPCGGF